MDNIYLEETKNGTNIFLFFNLSEFWKTKEKLYANISGKCFMEIKSLRIVKQQQKHYLQLNPKSYEIYTYSTQNPRNRNLILLLLKDRQIYFLECAHKSKFYSRNQERNIWRWRIWHRCMHTQTHIWSYEGIRNESGEIWTTERNIKVQLNVQFAICLQLCILELH